MVGRKVYVYLDLLHIFLSISIAWKHNQDFKTMAIVKLFDSLIYFSLLEIVDRGQEIQHSYPVYP